MWGILMPDEAYEKFSNCLTDAGDVFTARSLMFIEEQQEKEVMPVVLSKDFVLPRRKEGTGEGGVRSL